MDLTKSKEFIETGILTTPKKPYDWVIRRISHLCVVGRGRVISNEDIAQNPGIYPVYSSQTENNGELGKIATYDFDGDYLTWTTDGANAGTVFRRSGCFSCTNVCGTLKIKNNLEVDIDFLNYALSVQTKFFVRKDINPKLMNDVMAGIKVILPSIKLQKTLANYLDRETAKIDTLISAKERLLDLLTEKRRALMTHAVTYGLNHNSPRTDSEVKLFSNIPQHWKISRLRWFVKTLEQGWSPQAEEREISEEEWGVLKLNAVKEGQFDDSKAKALPESIDIPMNLEICPGDFLITRGNTPDLVGDVCYVSKTRPNLILSDLIYRLRLDELKLNGKFLNFFLQSHVGRLQIVSDARGSSASMVKISQEHILNWLIPIPPIDEQNQIVDYIKTNVLKLDNLTVAAKRTIELLQERRTALITAAVTGQIKVAA